MQSKSKQILHRFLLISAVALSLPVGTAMAQSSMMGADGHQRMASGHGMDGGMQRDHIAAFRRLDLSAEQQKQLRLLRDAQQDTTRPIMRGLREERIALHELVSSDQYESKKAGEIAEKIGRLNGQLALAMAEGRRKMLAMLTPDQRAKLKDLPNGHMGRH